jgi:hypothetical protein
MSDGESSGRGFLIVALAVSIVALFLVPWLGYLLFATFAVVAWVRREPPVTRWTLTIAAAVLILLSVTGFGTSPTVDRHGSNSVILHRRH